MSTHRSARFKSPQDPSPSQTPTQDRKPSAARIKARSLGIRAEIAAQNYLRQKGFEILEANVRVSRLEIDLIARLGEVLVIIEVRARGPRSLLRPFDSIGFEKRRRIRNAAKVLWTNRYRHDSTLERVRFDCIGVHIDRNGEAHIEHVVAAF
ncbi:MAG: YraN family protein [Polyangiaceae bacterium]|nr:YraN family protein [Polyangiaceae bacterium]